MDNLQLGQIWQQIADLLEILGENTYKVAAYRRGARSIIKSPVPLAELIANEELGSLPGIGKSLESSALEFFRTGKLELLAELERQVPEDLLLLTRLGVSPELAGRLHRELGIENLPDLEAALKERKVRKLRGIGPKGEQQLKHTVERAKEGLPHPGPAAEASASELRELLLDLPQIQKAEIAGSLRRGEEEVQTANLVLGTTLSKEELTSFLSGLPLVSEAKEEPLGVVLRGGLVVELSCVLPEAFYKALWQETGPRKHLEQLAALGELPELPAREEDIYRAAGVPYIPPLQRWGEDEISLSSAGKLPKPLTADIYKGDLHDHSNCSDGSHSLAELQARGEELGYEYLAICDHSRSLGVAGGLSIERLQARNAEIDALNAKGSSCRLLKGIELEIGAEGQLDYPLEVLAELDIVVGALHRGFGQPEEKVMERLRTALSTRAIFILAHPTGRLLGRRAALAVDLDELFQLARDYQVVLELNTSPDRLDLGAEALRRAKAEGIPIALNTDAHRLESLGQLQWGLKVATRGGLEAADLINTLSLQDLQKRIEKRKGGRY